MIRVNNLEKYYNKGRKNEQRVLNGVSLELGRTGLVCILGESGSGKTTLLNTIGGLDTFSGGTIDIDGTVLKKYDPKKMEPVRNEKFDYVFQNYYLLQDYPVSYNIKLALNRYDMPEEEKDARVDYVLDMLGISKYKKKIVSKLSGGQKQRVSIARALVKSPDVILADEPTGNLDEENTIRTMSILKNISKECLVILVSHERRIAEFFADRIIEIRDGEIFRDEINQAGDSYERSDDSNIYLRELKKTTVESENALVEIYQHKNDIPERLNLTFAWKDGRLYIKNNMNCDILMEGIENGVLMLDEERPKLDMSEVEDFAYELPKMKCAGKAKLSAKEIFRLAVENIRLMGKKHAFVSGIMLVTAVLLSVIMVEFINTAAVDESKVIATDTHYISVKFTKKTTMKRGKTMWRAMEYIQKNMNGGEHGEAFFQPKLNVYMTGSGYAQLKNLTQMMSGFSYTPVKYLKEEALVCGAMPKKRNEVALDRQVIDNMERQNGPVTSLQDGLESYVGMRLSVGGADTEMYVTGVCDTGQPTVYCGQNVLLGMNPKGYKIASVEELRQEDGEEYGGIDLKEDEMLMRKGLYDSLKDYEDVQTRVLGDDTGHVYKVAGTVPDEIGVDYVLSDAGCRNVRNLMIYEEKNCLIYSDNVDEAADYYKKAGEEFKSAFTTEVSVPSRDEVEAYKKAHSENMEATNLITAAIVLISLVMVYFTIKSNAASRIEELTVYRLLGISRGSILKAYMLEMVILTCYTSLPAVLLTGGVIRFVSQVPSLEIQLLFPWWSMFVLLAGIYLVHIVISVLPVYGILTKPPATLAVKD